MDPTSLSSSAIASARQLHQGHDTSARHTLHVRQQAGADVPGPSTAACCLLTDAWPWRAPRLLPLPESSRLHSHAPSWATCARSVPYKSHARAYREYWRKKYMMLGRVTLCCDTASPAAPCRARTGATEQGPLLRASRKGTRQLHSGVAVWSGVTSQPLQQPDPIWPHLALAQLQEPIVVQKQLREGGLRGGGCWCTLNPDRPQHSRRSGRNKRSRRRSS